MADDAIDVADDVAGQAVPAAPVNPVATQKFSISGTDVHFQEMVQGVVNFPWDYVALTQTATEDIYTFKTGGSGGTTRGTVTITYTDATKATIDNVART